MEATGDHYATLEVRPGVDEDGLRLAYRALMRRYHPDVAECDDAEERCRAINAAYACLRDPASRATYDARRRAQHRARRAAFTDMPQATQPTWPVNHRNWLGEDDTQRALLPRLAIIGAAIALTFVTFAVTSAVGTRSVRSAVGAETPRTIVMKAQPQRGERSRP